MTPAEWLENLPIIKENPDLGMYIYTGYVTTSNGNFNNVVADVYEDSGLRLRIPHPESSTIVVFNPSTGEFSKVNYGSATPGVASQIINGGGISNASVGSAIIMQIGEFSQDIIIGRIDPV